jgi:adenosine deaminase CECR1
MPKGAVLHAHLDGMADPDWFLSEAANYPELHLSLTGLYPSQSSLLAFQAFPEGFEASPLADAFDATRHSPENWYNYAEFVADPTTRAERITFLKSKMTLTVPDIGHLSCSSAIWKKFQTTFGATDGLARYEPLFKKHLRHVIEGLVADGVSYVEVRANFLMRFMRRKGSCKEDVNHFEWYEMFEQVVESIKSDLREQGREGDFIGAKVGPFHYRMLRLTSSGDLHDHSLRLE